MALEYAETSEKFIFITDLCEISTTRYDSHYGFRIPIDNFEDDLESRAIQLGFMMCPLTEDSI